MPVIITDECMKYERHLAGGSFSNTYAIPLGLVKAVIINTLLIHYPKGYNRKIIFKELWVSFPYLKKSVFYRHLNELLKSGLLKIE